jgi:hypothetical protein
MPKPPGGMLVVSLEQAVASSLGPQGGVSSFLKHRPDVLSRSAPASRVSTGRIGFTWPRSGPDHTCSVAAAL